MRITVAGTGYVGLVSGASFAEVGNHVTCLDLDVSKIEALNKGKVPIFEPGLAAMIERNVSHQRMSFTTDTRSAMQDAELIVVAVGTPQSADGSADVTAVEAVAKSAAEYAPQRSIVMLKSTVPVGTNAHVREILKEKGRQDIAVVSNPEFLKEGDAIRDFMRPDRIVIGFLESWVQPILENLYHPVCLRKDRIVWMNPPSAELTKYVSNTMLATRISMMNEIARLCEKVGADVRAVRQGVGSDSRLGNQFLYAGPGYGGSCFPKDISALIHVGRKHGVELSVAEATEQANEKQREFIAQKVDRALGDSAAGTKVAIWGIAFKPQTDDIRQSPSVALIEHLLQQKAKISAHDPEALGSAREQWGDRIELVKDPYQAVEEADLLVLMTEWREYQSPDFDRIKKLMKRSAIVDARNIWTTYKLQTKGFRYAGVGVV